MRCRWSAGGGKTKVWDSLAKYQQCLCVRKCELQRISESDIGLVPAQAARCRWAARSINIHIYLFGGRVGQFAHDPRKGTILSPQPFVLGF